jgi:hypothetical protein
MKKLILGLMLMGLTGTTLADDINVNITTTAALRAQPDLIIAKEMAGCAGVFDGLGTLAVQIHKPNLGEQLVNIGNGFSAVAGFYRMSSYTKPVKEYPNLSADIQSWAQNIEDLNKTEYLALFETKNSKKAKVLQEHCKSVVGPLEVSG